MIQRSIKRLSLRALIVDDELTSQSAEGRAARALVQELRERSIDAVEALSAEDGMSVIVSDSAIHAVLVDWTLGDDKGHARAWKLLEFVRARNDKIAISLMAERGEASSIPTIFFDYFGENLLRSDLSISVGDLGSLLDHTGPIGDHETYAARVFGAHRTGDLADQMFLQLKTSNQTQWLGRAFSTLPVQVMTPHKAYQRLVRGHVEHVPLTGLADHVLATSVVPYPPGIPMLMPGQSTGPADGPYLRYLRALASWDQRFPGFGHDTHGVENRNGVYYAQCLLPSRAGDVETQPQTVSQDLVEV